VGATFVTGLDVTPVFKFAERVVDLVALAVERLVMKHMDLAV
jgi:hypothetical protein